MSSSRSRESRSRSRESKSRSRESRSRESRSRESSSSHSGLRLCILTDIDLSSLIPFGPVASLALTTQAGRGGTVVCFFGSLILFGATGVTSIQTYRAHTQHRSVVLGHAGRMPQLPPQISSGVRGLRV